MILARWRIVKTEYGREALNLRRAKANLRRKGNVVVKRFEPLDPRRPLPQGLAWYVLSTAPKREFQVAAWLEAQGWNSLIPIENKKRNVSRHHRGAKAKVREFAVPLVPRMVFFGYPASEKVPWLTITDAYHITGVLGIKGTPAQMRPGEIDRLRDTSEALLRPMVLTPIEAGKRARMMAPGLWQGHVVDVASITGKHAKVIQNWFGVSTEVKVDVKDLEAA